MDITIYLPDDIALRAKDRGVNLSRMLRDALTAQFAEEDTMAATLEDATEIKLSLEDGTIGRFSGTRIASGENGVDVYLTADHNVLAYEVERERYAIVEDPENDLRDWFFGNYPHDPDAYSDAMRALGFTPIIDLDV